MRFTKEALLDQTEEAIIEYFLTNQICDEKDARAEAQELREAMRVMMKTIEAMYKLKAVQQNLTNN